jgi:hypothetical protein
MITGEMSGLYALATVISLGILVYAVRGIRLRRLRALRRSRTDADDQAAFATYGVDDRLVQLVQLHCRRLVDDPGFHVLPTDDLGYVYFIADEDVEDLCEDVLKQYLSEAGSSTARSTTRDISSTRAVTEVRTVIDVIVYVESVAQAG